MKRIDHAFGSWFSESEGSQRPPSPLRTTLAIWLGLYPQWCCSVQLCALAASSAGLARPARRQSIVCVRDDLSDDALLRKANGRLVLVAETHRRKTFDEHPGLLLILAINAAWALVFYLLTDKLSTSP